MEKETRKKDLQQIDSKSFENPHNTKLLRKKTTLVPFYKNILQAVIDKL